MRRYELIDAVDNDCHDEGTREEMQRLADERNAAEGLLTGGKPRWVVKPEGYAATNYKG